MDESWRVFARAHLIFMNKTSAINSCLLAISLGVMGWVAHKTADSGEALAGVRVSLEAAKEASSKAERISSEALLRLERKFDDAVPRREYEARLLQIETEQKKCDIRLREIDLEIFSLKQKQP